MVHIGEIVFNIQNKSSILFRGQLIFCVINNISIDFDIYRLG